MVDHSTAWMQRKGLQPEETVKANQKKKDLQAQGRSKAFRLAAQGKDHGLFQRKPTKRAANEYKPHGHKGVKLNVWQEFILYMIWIRR